MDALDVSTTTMASSRAADRHTRPNMDRVLMVKPKAAITPKVPSRTTGTAMDGMSVRADVLQEEEHHQKDQRDPSSRVLTTSWMRF